MEINLAVRVSKSNERPCRTAPNSHETSPEKVGNEKGERRLRIRSMHKLRDVRKGKYEQGKRHGHRWQRAIKGSSQNTTTHSPDPTLSSRVHAMKSHDNWHRGRLTRTTTRSLMEPNLPKSTSPSHFPPLFLRGRQVECSAERNWAEDAKQILNAR